MKTQLIRLIDVFALGPFLIYAAMQPRLMRHHRTALTVIGIATVLYNMANYLEQARIEKADTGGEAV